MAKRKKKFGGLPSEHRAEARGLSRLMRKEYRGARQALQRAAKKGADKLAQCSTALDYMMAGNAAKAAFYRERSWAPGRKGGFSANRVSESLKHRFRAVCLKHKRTSKSGHW